MLWRQRASHEWQGREEDQRSPRRGKNDNAARQTAVADSNRVQPVALSLKCANDVAKHSLTGAHPKASPIELFARVPLRAQTKGHHTFGAPVCVLDSKLQQGRHVGKWTNRSRIGMHLGMSSRHSHRVLLILNLRTGLVSPQCHCKHDDLFDALKPSAGNLRPTSSWQEKAGLGDIEDV